jgi:excisionase family DNA binding protein
MRDVIVSHILQQEGDDLLTTGEAATILSSSRQHVVDLCDRGDLPCTTIGTHRRIRRRDVEQYRARTARPSRDQRRSLWLSYATAGAIVRDPDAAVAVARKNLEGMRERARGQSVVWLDEWARLIDGPLLRLLATLTSPSPKGRELRQNSPFAGAVGEEERLRVLGAWATHDEAGSPR